ncbi:hypothetical protein [Okeania sp. SIO2C9]|uniref:hypothetical protein n=1 Tax=Okeania sp. SIO2C9 TaxID=2607791 RepID=UPI0025CC8DCE|nr:hypothetical protein [Okeania sp. SIO2C9]
MKKEEGRGKKEEGRGKREEVVRKFRNRIGEQGRKILPSRHLPTFPSWEGLGVGHHLKIESKKITPAEYLLGMKIVQLSFKERSQRKIKP